MESDPNPPVSYRRGSVGGSTSSMAGSMNSSGLIDMNWPAENFELDKESAEFLGLQGANSQNTFPPKDLKVLVQKCEDAVSIR